MEKRTSDSFTSDAAVEFKAQDKPGLARCAKTGRHIVDDKGIVVTVTSEQAVALSPRSKKVINFVFRLSEKALRQLVGGPGSILKVQHALKNVEMGDGDVKVKPVKARLVRKRGKAAEKTAVPQEA